MHLNLLGKQKKFKGVSWGSESGNETEIADDEAESDNSEFGI